MLRQILTAFLLLFLVAPAGADVDTAWVRRYVSPEDVYNRAYALAVDAGGNVYVTGEKGTEETRPDYTTIKYYPNGDTAWTRRYDGPNGTFDLAYDVALDELGNVFVTGWSEGVGTYIDYATVKYDSSGTVLWLRRYDGPVNSLDGANALALDNRGNVYVTGKSAGAVAPGRLDYATIRYYPNGDTAWVRRYIGPYLENEALAITVDDEGNVYVTGKSRGSGYMNYDYATVKYDSMGTELWARRYDWGGNYADIAYAIAVGDSGDVYVTGESWHADSGFTFATVKYDAEGNQLWVGRYRGTDNGFHAGYALGMDDLENVYVTGRGDDTGMGIVYATVKYLPNGDTAWARTYCDPDAVPDIPYAIAIDDLGDVYVTGMDHTVKYDSDGNQLWVGEWGGVDIAIDSSDDVYVTGWDAVSGKFRFVTVKYVQAGSGVEDQPGESQRPSQFALFQNQPNPFNQSTQIRFNLASSGFVRLTIHDIVGRKVRALVSEFLPAGHKSVFWDGKNDSGEEVASGVYFYRIQVGDFSETKKLVLLK